MFFVIGLPRSRTAWLANFLTYGDLFCWHELSAMFGDLHEMRGYTDRTPHVGTADSSLPARSTEMLEAYPHPEVVVIRRARADAARSISALGVPNVERVLSVAEHGIDQIAGRAMRLLEVDYDTMDSQLESIWDFVNGGPYNEPRASMLCRMNVQVPLDRVVASPVALRKLATRLEV